MARFDAQFREIGLILQLSTFYQNLLSLRFHTGKGVELEFEGLACGTGIEFDVIFLALVFDNDCSKCISECLLIFPHNERDRAKAQEVYAKATAERWEGAETPKRL